MLARQDPGYVAGRPATIEDLARLRPVAAGLEQQLDLIADEMVTFVVGQLDPVAADEDIARELHVSARANVAAFLALAAAGAPDTEIVPPPGALAFARSLVRHGAPLELLLRAYSVGHMWMQRRMAAELADHAAGADDLRRTLDASAWLLFRYVDAVVTAASRDYAAERDRWLQTAVARRVSQVAAIIGGEALDLDLDVASQSLGYELRRTHVGLVVWADTAADFGAIEDAARGLAREFGAERPLLVPHGASAVWAWAGFYGACDTSPSRDEIDRLLGRGLHAAAGVAGAGLEGFRVTHEEARQAQRMAAAHGTRFTPYADVELLSLVDTDRERVARFVARQLGDLAAGDEATKRLRETLRVYFAEDRSPKRTAERLATHKNTIFYRLQSAEQRRGRPLRDQPLELALALRLAETTLAHRA